MTECLLAGGCWQLFALCDVTRAWFACMIVAFITHFLFVLSLRLVLHSLISIVSKIIETLKHLYESASSKRCLDSIPRESAHFANHHFLFFFISLSVDSIIIVSYFWMFVWMYAPQLTQINKKLNHLLVDWCCSIVKRCWAYKYCQMGKKWTKK